MRGKHHVQPFRTRNCRVSSHFPLQRPFPCPFSMAKLIRYQGRVRQRV